MRQQREMFYESQIPAHISVLSFGVARTDRNAGALGMKRSLVETL